MARHASGSGDGTIGRHPVGRDLLLEDARVREIWDEIWSLLEDGDAEKATSTALRALNEEDRAEFRYLLGIGLLDLAEPEAAIPELEKACERDPAWVDPRTALAWAQFRVCRFDDAKASVEKALEGDDEIPEAHQLRGLLAERDEDDDTAALAFAEARRLAPDDFPDPYTMPEDEFLAVAQDAVRELEAPVLEVLEETAFFVQDVPAEPLLKEADPPLDPQLLGLFVGRSLLEQSVQDSGTLPNTMYLFQRNLERVAGTREELEEEIRITVLHEIGHHLGWGEEELEARGLA